jgi:two-component system cell cycle response regulator DivK
VSWRGFEAITRVGQKILVVEDNELNLKLFCDLLRAHGYEAEPVRDGREAVDRARSFRPDLVVMDIQMPWISGLELIEQMKGDEELRATPIMAVTAYAAKGDEERIREAGAEGYVSKPISLMRFIEAVRGLLEAAEQAPDGVGESERHPRESGDPDEASSHAEGDEAALDSRFRGNDEEGSEEASAAAGTQAVEGEASGRPESPEPPAPEPAPETGEDKEEG